MNIDPTTTKYMIKANLIAEGIVEKPDIVGAIFGQTEGLLGDELDLRDLQKSGRIGRIEVEVGSKQGRSDGRVMIPSSLDQVETVILASALETIDRVGPCKARIHIESIEDVRIMKRARIISRAKELLGDLMRDSKSAGIDLTESVRQSVQMEEIIHYGKERLPAGPNVMESDAIIIVEGRNDVLNLLRSGIKNSIAVEGTNIPKTVQELSKERVITAFVDGDRGGELILRELFQVAEVDFVARAPRGQEVEEITQKQIMKCLRNKIPGDQFMEMYGITDSNGKREPRPERDERRDERRPRFDRRDDRRPRPREDRFKREAPTRAPVAREDPPVREEPPLREAPPVREEPPLREAPRYHREERPKPPAKKLPSGMERLRDMINDMGSSSKGMLLDGKYEILREVPVRELVNSLKDDSESVEMIVFDGIITQRIMDIASAEGIKVVVGTRMGNITKQPTGVEAWSKDDLN